MRRHVPALVVAGIRSRTYGRSEPLSDNGRESCGGWFARWYETPLDLPGVYYLQAVEWLFKENRLAKGKFVALGKTLSLKDITIPVYMLAGEADDITPAAQVFNAEKYLGTQPNKMIKKLAPGGHIGLFMGRKTLEETWPAICRWILSYDAYRAYP